MIEKKFLSQLGDSWQSAAPGVLIQAHHKGRKILDVGVGDTYKFYDFASVTKIVFTTTAFMFLHDDKKFRLRDPIHRWVDWYPDSSPWRIQDLMCHSAGLTWWYPFYKSVVKKTTAKTSPERVWRIFETILRRRVIDDLKKRPKREGPNHAPKSVYSDLDFFILGLSLESISQCSLYNAWTDVRERVGLKNTDFHRGNRPNHKRSLYAPTEDDRVWRGRVLQGEVHDQNTWSFKGVAPHAGLFGTMSDLSQWGLLLRNSIQGHNSKHFPSPATVQLFTKRAIPRSRGDWARGFMMPSKENASCGPLFSLKSVGHTGYTGTSLWYDPVRDLLVTILSNRIHPSVDNIEIRKLRPKVHSLIVKSL